MDLGPTKELPINASVLLGHYKNHLIRQDMNKSEFTLFSIDSAKQKRGLDKDNFHYHYADNLSGFDDFVIMYRGDYESLFHVPRNKAKNRLKRLSVIKITYADNEGHSHSIYRKFRPCDNEAFRGCVAVSYHSLLFLNEGFNSILGKKVRIEKSCSCLYYMNHPNEVVLFSYTTSVLSITFAFLSLIVAILSFFNFI